MGVNDDGTEVPVLTPVARDVSSKCDPPLNSTPMDSKVLALQVVDAPGRLPVSTTTLRAANAFGNLTLMNSKLPYARSEGLTVLLLCSGPDGRPGSIISLLAKSGFGGVSYDVENGSHFDLADDAVWDPPSRYEFRRVNSRPYSRLHLAPRSQGLGTSLVDLHHCEASRGLAGMGWPASRLPTWNSLGSIT